MKRIVSVLALILLLLVGCQTVKNGTLDTSNLTKVDMKDVTEEQAKKIPITYEAQSVKVGLDALPFEMYLPEELPFDAQPFHPPVISDMTHDGKKLMVEFRTSTKYEDNNIILMIKAGYPVSDMQVPNAEEVELKNGVVGKYLKNTVSWKLDNVVYDVIYVNKNIPVEQHKEEIIQIANQMIK